MLIKAGTRVAIIATEEDVNSSHLEAVFRSFVILSEYVEPLVKDLPYQATPAMKVDHDFNVECFVSESKTKNELRLCVRSWYSVLLDEHGHALGKRVTVLHTVDLSKSECYTTHCEMTVGGCVRELETAAWTHGLKMKEITSAYPKAVGLNKVFEFYDPIEK